MRIVVVGDVLLDVDLEGIVERLSPDAPVPVLDVSSRRSRAGGAGLAATLLRADGHEVVLVTALAEDEGGSLLRERLGAMGIEVVAGVSGAPTPEKIRVRSTAQAICRIDEGCAPPPEPAVDPAMTAALRDADAILVSDYGRRLTSHPVMRYALTEQAARVPLVWDPHPRGAIPVPGTALVTPNAREAAAAVEDRSSGGAERNARLLRDQYRAGAVLVTLGSQGAVLAVGQEVQRIHGLPVPAADPCGAGDRLAATATAEIAGGASPESAARSAVEAAGRFLRAGGVAAALPDVGDGVVAADAEADPAVPDPFRVARAVRARGGTLVAAGGCFDLLHVGHLRMLESARALGDALIVCLNSDDSVRRLKGAERPIVGEEDRREMLAALDCVDAVAVFDEDGPEALLERLRPEVWVKGGDYTADALPEAGVLRSWGGRIVTMPYLLGRSTTRLSEALARVG